MAKKESSQKESTKTKTAKSPKAKEEKKPKAAKPAAKEKKTAAKTPKTPAVKKKSDETKVKKVKTPKAAASEPVKKTKEAMKEPKKETQKKTAAVKEPKTRKPRKSANAAAPEKPSDMPYIQEPVPPKRPIVLSKKYGKEDLEEFRRLILEKRSEIIRQIQNLQEQMKDPTTGEYINENSPYSLHMAEQGTDAMEREKTYLYIQRETKFLTYLDDALERIDAGTYGVCIECIDEPKHLCPTCPLISKQRLEAVPHSKLCVEIKKLQEKNRRF